MKFPINYLIAVVAGAVFLFHSLRAAPNEPRAEYKVIFNSLQYDHFQRDLNEAAASGWKLEKFDALAIANPSGVAIMSREKR